MNSTGGRSVERRKDLTSQVVGVELEWGAGWGNPAPQVLRRQGSAGADGPACLDPLRNSSTFLDANLNFGNPTDHRRIQSILINLAQESFSKPKPMDFTLFKKSLV
jgi:hypothetical protein